MRPITASDLMNPGVLTVSLDMSIPELANFLVAHEISGAPVVDAAGKLVGVVSLLDIAEVLADDEEEDGERSDYFASEWDEGLSAEEIEELPPDAKALTVADILTQDVYTVNEETTVSEIAERMIGNHIHRLLVTREDRVVGIISSSDLLGLLVEEKE